MGRAALAAGLAFAVGYLPHAIGARVDPHDAYVEQYETIFRARGPVGSPSGRIEWDQARDLARGHARLLALDCLPRLIAGHRLPGLESEPQPAALGAGRTPPLTAPGVMNPIAVVTIGLALGLFGLALVALVLGPGRSGRPAEGAVRWGQFVTAGLVAGGFVLNRNIYNSATTATWCCC